MLCIDSCQYKIDKYLCPLILVKFVYLHRKVFLAFKVDFFHFLGLHAIDTIKTPIPLLPPTAPSRPPLVPLPSPLLPPSRPPLVPPPPPPCPDKTDMLKCGPSAHTITSMSTSWANQLCQPALVNQLWSTSCGQSAVATSCANQLCQPAVPTSCANQLCQPAVPTSCINPLF